MLLGYNPEFCPKTQTVHRVLSVTLITVFVLVIEGISKSEERFLEPLAELFRLNFHGGKHVVHREEHYTPNYTTLFANGFIQSKYLVKNPLMTKGFSQISVFSELPGSTNYAELTSSGCHNEISQTGCLK